MKLIAAISEEQDLAQVPGLLERAGIQVESREAGENRVYLCRRDDAEASVVVMKRTPWDQFLAGPLLGAGPLREKVANDIKAGGKPDFFPAYIFAKHGFFRWLLHRSRDRELQRAIAQALEPITYARIDWKG